MKYAERQTQPETLRSLQLTKSNAFQFQALICRLSSRWWPGRDPGSSVVCTRCWHSCKPNFGKQGKRQDRRCCGSCSGLGLVPWERSSISHVCQAWVLLPVIACSLKQSNSLSKLSTLSSERSWYRNMQKCLNLQSLKLSLCIPAHHALQPASIRTGSDLDDNDGTVITSVSNFGFHSVQCWVKIWLEHLYNKIGLSNSINSK